MADPTTANPPPRWGPYANAREATMCLCRFADAAVGHDVGVIWSDGQSCMLLRRPILDADGFGDALIAEWMGPLPTPPSPPPPLNLWGRIKQGFEHALEMQGEAAIAESEANMAMGQSIADWFSNKDHEHEVGLAFDIIGVVGFALLFVPGIGEAEMLIVGLGTLARVTAVSAGIGASCGLYADGKYLRLRFEPGQSEEHRIHEAEEWDNSPQATTLSLAAAILALPDFVVGGVMTVRDLQRLPGEAAEARKLQAGYQAAADARNAKAARLMERAPNEPAWRGAKVQAKAATISARAQRLTEKAQQAALRSQRLRTKLIVAMGLNAPGTLIGTPAAESYYAHDLHHDHPHDPAATLRTSRDYLEHAGKPVLRKLLDPPFGKSRQSTPGTNNLNLHIGAVGRSPSAGP